MDTYKRIAKKSKDIIKISAFKNPSDKISKDSKKHEEKDMLKILKKLDSAVSTSKKNKKEE